MAVRLKRVKGKNVLTYETLDLPLENQGLVLVRGKNFDQLERTGEPGSNGAAKSAMFDVLRHLLVGETARGTRGPQIVRAGALEPAVATLELEKDGEKLLIEQTIDAEKGKSSTKVMKRMPYGDEPISHLKAKKRTQTMIAEDILNWTEQQIDAGLYISQESAHPLVNGTGAECAKYISDTFGLECYDEMHDKLKDRVKQCTEQMGESIAYEQMLRSAEERLARIPNADKALKAAAAAKVRHDDVATRLKSLRAQATRLADQLTKAELRAQLLEQLGDNATVDVEEFLKSANKRAVRINALEEEIAKIRGERSDAERIQKYTDQIETDQARIAALVKDSPRLSKLLPTNPTREAFDACVKQEQTRDKAIRELMRFHADVANKQAKVLTYGPILLRSVYVESLEIAAPKREALLAKQAAASAGAAMLVRLEKLNEPKCPSCGQDVDTDHLRKELKAGRAAKEQLQKINAQLEDLDRHIEIWKESLALLDSLDALREMAKHLWSGLDWSADIVAAMRMSEDDERNENVMGRLRSIKTLFEDIEGIASKRALLSADRTPAELTVEEDQLRKKLDALKDQHRDTQALVGALKRLRDLPETEPVDILKDQLEKARAKLESNSEEVEKLSEEYRAASVEAQRVKAVMDERDAAAAELAKHGDLRRQTELLKTLSKAIKRLKVRRIHAIVQGIQEKLPEYSAIMFQGEDVTFEVDDQDPDSIERWCSRPNPNGEGERVRIPVRALSKGERARLRVAFIWAVRELQNAERSVNVLALDEADGGLDKHGLEAYGQLLELIRNSYESVFVISHRKELSNVQFDQVWTVEKRGGVSRLVRE